MAENITLTDLDNLENDTSVVTAINNNNSAIETAFQDTVSRSGVSPNTMESNLDMNSNRILNLPTPTSNYEPIRLVDVSTINTSGITVSSLPAGGSTSQVLTKNSGNNYDVSWENPQTIPSGGLTGQVFVKNSSLNGDFGWSSAPTLSSINTNTGVLSLPSTVSDTLVSNAAAATLTNKTISGTNNNITNIQTSSLNGGTNANSSTFWRGDGTWNSPPTGTVIYLETLTGNNVNSVASTVSWSGYSNIHIIVLTFTTAVSNVIPGIQFHANGSYQTTGYVASAGYMNSFNPSSNWGSNKTSTTYIPFSPFDIHGVTTDMSGEIKLYNIASTVQNKHAIGHFCMFNTGAGASYWCPCVGNLGVNSAIDGCKILADSGNNFSCIINIYGIV